MGLRESNSPTAALEGGRRKGWREVVDGERGVNVRVGDERRCRELEEIWERHRNWEKTLECEGWERETRSELQEISRERVGMKDGEGRSVLQVNPKSARSRKVFHYDNFKHRSASVPTNSFQRERQFVKARCQLSCSCHPRVECGINGKVMQRLEKEAKSGGGRGGFIHWRE